MSVNTNQPKANRPFLKWAGGKVRLVDRIKAILPEGNRLIEPFVGSGAVFLNTDYKHYLLGDINPDLINLYNCLKQEGEGFIDYAEAWFCEKENDKDAYYHWRDTFNQSHDTRQKSALFLYLNRHGYNGLCRYNSSGKLNVPFGSYKKPYFPRIEMLNFAKKSKKATFVCCSFEDLMDRARKNNVIYCDPPYVPLSDSANFTNYAKQGFGLDSQMQLAVKANKLSQRGISVLISNHENAVTRELYQHASISRFPVKRLISCKGSSRKDVIELLAFYSAKK
ncbi:MAG: DNA adenine methylase [Gammaproteobacteria bacterium]|nr:MAG: DNA adenine methylase [Gammaproteobacteria bacterium]